MLPGTDGEQRLSVLYRTAVFDQFRGHDTRHLRLNLVHELHRLDDAEHLPGLDRVAGLDERRRPGSGRIVIRPDDWRFHQHLPGFRLGRWRWSASSRNGNLRRRSDWRRWLGRCRGVLRIRPRPPDAETVFAALQFQFPDPAFIEDLQQLFDLVDGHY